MTSRSDGLPRDADRIYFPALDGLRTICFASVVFGHGFVFTPIQEFASRMAGAGVHVFFALSGFLITTLLLREHSGRGRIDLPAFYTRRALRVFPVYYAAVLVGVGGLFLLGDRFAQVLGVKLAELDLPGIAITHALFVANWSSLRVPGALDVLWSISVEEQFYILFPISFAWSRHPRAAVPAITVGIVIALAVRSYLVSHADPHTIYRNTFATGDHLLLGALAAQFVHSDRQKVVAWVRRLGTLGEVAAFGTVVLLCCWTRNHPWEWFVDASLSAAASAAIVLLVGVGDGRMTRWLAIPWMRRLGALTYSAYVFHIYALIVAWALCAKLGFRASTAALLRSIVGGGLAFAIAYIVRVAFERRVLAWKRHFERA